MLTQEQKNFITICEARLPDPYNSDLTLSMVAEEMGIPYYDARKIYETLFTEDMIYLQSVEGVDGQVRQFLQLVDLFRYRTLLTNTYYEV